MIVGTAPDKEAYLIAEIRKPWPAKIKKMEGLVPRLRSALKSHKSEEVHLVATPKIPWLEPADYPRALLVQWDGKQAVSRLVEADPDTILEALKEPPGEEPFECYAVCTHGTRDPCCGQLGVPVFLTLRDSASRRVLQVSHLGGHRFAPVVGVFPEWRFFGHLTPQGFLELDRALAAKVPYLTGYRGNGRLSKHLQLIEAQAWQEHSEMLDRVEWVSGDKRSARVAVHLKNGQTEHYYAEFGSFDYRGYKTCEDYRNNKMKTLKLPRLQRYEQLTPVS